MLDKMASQSTINEGKNRFKDTTILLITLIIPLTISIIAIYAGYYIPSTASLAAQQNCRYPILPYTNMSNMTQYNNCVQQQTYTTTSNEFTNLSRYLSQSFIILFVIVVLIIFHLLFAKGLLMYVTEIVMAVLLIWEFLFLISIAYFNGAIYTPIVNGSNGIPVNSATGSLFSVAIFVFQQTNKSLQGQFMFWYIILFLLMFLELIIYTIIRAKNEMKKEKS